MYSKEVRMVWLRRMLGLLDKNERLLDIGFLESLNFNNKQLVVSTSLRNGDDVKYVKFGYLRIDGRGNEIGRRETDAI